MKKKNIEYKCGTLTRDAQLFIDESFVERIIPASDSVRRLDQIIGDIDLVPLEIAMKRTGRKHRTNPVTMLKILMYDTMQCNYSSRSVEQS